MRKKLTNGEFLSRMTQIHPSIVALGTYVKTDYCLNNDILLIRIPYWELDNTEDILSHAIYERQRCLI